MSQYTSTPNNKAQENFTDPDSRIMKHGNGAFDQRYNGQTAVDAEIQIIVAAELTQNAEDGAGLPVILNAKKLHAELLRTKPGRCRLLYGTVLKELSEVDSYLTKALGREGRNNVDVNAEEYLHTAQMAEKLQTQAAQELCRKRKNIVEPTNAWIKSVLSFGQFSKRGHDKVRNEWKLVYAALNLR